MENTNDIIRVDASEISRQLSSYSMNVIHYGIVLLDMLRSNEIDQQEYDMKISVSNAAHEQFKKKLLAPSK